MLIIWPDGEWCWESELADYSWKSDDYQRVGVPEWADDQDADNLAQIVKRKGFISDADVLAYFQLD